MEKKRSELAKKESEIGGEEQRGKNAEEIISKARQKLEALAKGMTTDEQGNAMTLDAYLTSNFYKNFFENDYYYIQLLVLNTLNLKQL